MEVKKLEKVTNEELAAADPKTVAQLTTDVAEVEGQEPYLARVECGWCGQISRVILDTDYIKYYRCGSCGYGGRRGA